MTSKELRLPFLALVIGLAFGTVMVLFTPTFTDAATTCSFTRDLGMGANGEDVRCLQQYLNGNGFTVSSYGAGAPGYESYIFGPKTQAAVIRWQSAHGYPVTGVFQVSYMYGQNYGQNTDSNSYYSTNNASILRDLRDARKAYNEALDDYLDAVHAGRAVGDARDYLDDARDEIWDAYDAYVSGDYREASNLANDAEDDANNAQDEIDGVDHNNNSDRSDAKNAIDDAHDAISDARYEIDHSNSSQSRINRAENYLNDAEDAYDDAQNAYDDKDYQEAVDRANDAEDYAKDAIDAL